MAALNTHLVFDSDIGRTKPVTVTPGQVSCPFCRRDQLEGIIAEDGPIILLNNKYPVLRDTVQTVLIETDICDSELSMYSKDHLHRVIRFGIEKWQGVIDSGRFASVIFYKNHGPYSGGTIRHPHMQIIGLRHIDYRPNIAPESLLGEVIDRDGGAELNLTGRPQIGFFEFNVRLLAADGLDRMADYIQMVVHYILNHFHAHCTSYNLFFYQIAGEISVKIVPRFVTSPLFVGYAIPQVASRSTEVMKTIRRLYLA